MYIGHLGALRGIPVFRPSRSSAELVPHCYGPHRLRILVRPPIQAENRVMAMIEARRNGCKGIGQDFIDRKAKDLVTPGTGPIQRRLSFSGFSRLPGGGTRQMPSTYVPGPCPQPAKWPKLPS